MIKVLKLPELDGLRLYAGEDPEEQGRSAGRTLQQLYALGPDVRASSVRWKMRELGFTYEHLNYLPAEFETSTPEQRERYLNYVAWLRNGGSGPPPPVPNLAP